MNSSIKEIKTEIVKEFESQNINEIFMRASLANKHEKQQRAADSKA